MAGLAPTMIKSDIDMTFLPNEILQKIFNLLTIKNYDKKKSYNMMITSFLVYLDIEKQKDLEKNGVIIPNYEPMFNYPKYLCCLNINGLKGAIVDKIVMKNERLSSLLRNLVMKYILIMLSNRDNKLESITIRIGYGRLAVSISDIRILLNPNFRSLIEPVKKMNLLLGSPTDGFILKLSSICQKL
ncbi:9120_t:CDS:2, partial [Scutellospora calospora]